MVVLGGITNELVKDIFRGQGDETLVECRFWLSGYGAAVTYQPHNPKVAGPSRKMGNTSVT